MSLMSPRSVTFFIGISCVLFLRLSVVLWCLLLYGLYLSAVGFLFSPWSCHRYVTHRHLVCAVFGVCPSYCGLFCCILFICRPWDSCLVPGLVIVTIGISCVLFLRLSVVLWSPLLYSLYLSAVRLFVPCIVVADPIGCLSYSHLVRLSVEFRHSLSIVCSPWATTPHPTGRRRVSGERRWLSPRGLIPGH